MSVLTAAVREQALAVAAPLQLGRVAEVIGLQLRVTGLRAAIGDLVEIDGSVLAEVAAGTPDGLVCLHLAQTAGLRVGATVRHTGGPLTVGVDEELLGRVLGGIGIGRANV